MAGGSARAKAAELRAAERERRQALKARRPVLGRLQLAVAGPPTAGDSWAKGAAGEEKLGAGLDALARERDDVVVLHDRRRPRTSANIDHLAITPSGVWVIDCKRWKGLIAPVDRGGWRRADVRLTVGGRDRTDDAVKVHRQRDAVAEVLDRSGLLARPEPVPIRGVLCFVDGELRLFAKPFLVDGILIAWPRALRQQLVQPGPLDAGQRGAVARALDAGLRPAH